MMRRPGTGGHWVRLGPRQIRVRARRGLQGRQSLHAATGRDSPQHSPILETPGGQEVPISLPPTGARVLLPVQEGLVVLWLWFGATLLYLLDQWVYFHHMRQWPELAKMVLLTREANLPTLYAAGLFALPGVVATALGLLLRGTGQRQRGMAWLAVGGLFLFFAVDEAAVIHERVGALLGGWVESGPSQSKVVQSFLAFPGYAWEILVLPFYLLAGLAVARWVVMEMGRDARGWFLLGGGGLLLGLAIVLEFIDGTGEYRSFSLWLDLPLRETRHVMQSLEEYAEMVGMILLGAVFLRLLRRELCCRGPLWLGLNGSDSVPYHN
ncbi:MAG: hypothetical protein H7831_04955 [Magnetococcus sp. WYHC-3]